MTTLTLQHIDETPNSTVSGLTLNGQHVCYIVEDGHRDVKVKGRTRIPAGTYELFPRQSGGFWGRYHTRWGHDFVIGFKSVPNFKWILIHIGNSVLDTDGCLLCGKDYKKDIAGNYVVTDSTETYLMLYDLFAEFFDDGPVFIEIDRGIVPEPPITEPPVTSEPEEPVIVTPDKPKPPIPKAKDIGCGGLAVILLIASLFGAAIGIL